jgi:hypothetical protein
MQSGSIISPGISTFFNPLLLPRDTAYKVKVGHALQILRLNSNPTSTVSLIGTISPIKLSWGLPIHGTLAPNNSLWVSVSYFRGRLTNGWRRVGVA